MLFHGVRKKTGPIRPSEMSFEVSFSRFVHRHLIVTFVYRFCADTELFGHIIGDSFGLQSRTASLQMGCARHISRISALQTARRIYIQMATSKSRQTGSSWVAWYVDRPTKQRGIQNVHMGSRPEDDPDAFSPG